MIRSLFAGAFIVFIVLIVLASLVGHPVSLFAGQGFSPWHFFGGLPLPQIIGFAAALWLLSCIFRGSRHGGQRSETSRADSSLRELDRKLDALHGSVSDLQLKAAEGKDAENAELKRKLAELSERIVVLERIVTDRRYQLDEKISEL